MIASIYLTLYISVHDSLKNHTHQVYFHKGHFVGIHSITLIKPSNVAGNGP